MRIVIVGLLVILVNVGFPLFSQQVTPLQESDAPPNVVVKHYAQYGGCTSVTWTKTEESGGVTYGTRFYHDGLWKEAVFNRNGRLLVETTKREDIPVVLAGYIEEMYEKYKILEVKSSKDFQNEAMLYTVVMKTKVHGEFTLTFDQHFTLLDNATGFAYEK